MRRPRMPSTSSVMMRKLSCKPATGITWWRGGHRRGLLTLGQEAGRRAEELAREMRNQESNKSNTVSSMMDSMHIDTILAHAGISSSSSSTTSGSNGGGDNKHIKSSSDDNIPLAPPMHFASTYTRPSDGIYPERSSLSHHPNAIYIRGDSPTRRLLEEQIAILECHGGDDAIEKNGHEAVCCAFASGNMAASAIVLAHKAPLHVLLPTDVYHGVSTTLYDVFSRFQVSVERVDMRNLKAVQQSLESAATDGNDVIVWMETPSNPLCHILDIQAISKLVRGATASTDTTATVVVDSTLAPCTIQQPLLHGADAVLHSGTKYIGGHSDALLGVVTTSPWTARGRELGPVLQQVQHSVGGVASTMDSWLALRGLRTLATRVAKQCQTAMTLAKFLQDQPSVAAVYYPGLSSSSSQQEQHETAKRQMRQGAFGGVLSIEMPDECHAMAFAGALQTIYRATSLGGTETLLEHRRSIEPPERATSPPGLLRISVGLEDAEDLVKDIKNALEIAERVVNESRGQ